MPSTSRPLRWAVGGVVIVAVLAFLGMRLSDVVPHRFSDTGTLARFGNGCLGIDLDGDRPGLRPIERWPAGILVDLEDGTIVDGRLRPVASIGDRLVVTATLIRAHGDIDPCLTAERLTIESFAVLASPTPAP